VQTLSVESIRTKRSQSDAGQTAVHVYQFDHNAQISRLVMVDPINGVALKQRTIDSVHLPLNTAEIDYARAALLANDAAMTRLASTRTDRDAYPDSTLDGLNAKAVIFEPDNSSHRCAVTRCVLLAFFDNNYRALPVEPIVELATRSIIWLDAQ